MKTSELFLSCQGEGPDVGVPAFFVRLTGCNVRCAFCDTGYAFEGGIEHSVEELVEKIKLLTCDSGCELIVITGGEPLLQQHELAQLVSELSQDFRFAVETNGTLPRPSWWQEVVWDVDYKCPSSGVHTFDGSWLATGMRNRIKFVVSDEEDLRFVLSVLPTLRRSLRPVVLVSPVVPNTSANDIRSIRPWLQRVWGFCAENNLRYSLQVHKVVFGSRRGV